MEGLANLFHILFEFVWMAQRNQFNIGETNKTSVKVHHGPGGQSNWSLGWSDPLQSQADQKAKSNHRPIQT